MALFMKPSVSKSGIDDTYFCSEKHFLVNSFIGNALLNKGLDIKIV